MIRQCIVPYLGFLTASSDDQRAIPGDRAASAAHDRQSFKSFIHPRVIYRVEGAHFSIDHSGFVSHNLRSPNEQPSFRDGHDTLAVANARSLAARSTHNAIDSHVHAA